MTLEWQPINIIPGYAPTQSYVWRSDGVVATIRPASHGGGYICHLQDGPGAYSEVVYAYIADLEEAKRMVADVIASRFQVCKVGA